MGECTATQVKSTSGTRYRKGKSSRGITGSAARAQETRLKPGLKKSQRFVAVVKPRAVEPDSPLSDDTISEVRYRLEVRSRAAPQDAENRSARNQWKIDNLRINVTAP